MKDTEKLGVDLTLTRRQMLGSVGVAAGAATVLSMAPWADVQAEVDKLKKKVGKLTHVHVTFAVVIVAS